MTVMAKLITAVHVRDPERHRTVLLLPGEEPEPRLAALITNPGCWEDGKLPGTPEGDPSSDDKSEEPKPDQGDDTEDTKPAARKQAAKKTAARKPAAN